MLYSWNDLEKKFSSNSDIWMVLDNVVYDKFDKTKIVEAELITTIRNNELIKFINENYEKEYEYVRVNPLTLTVENALRRYLKIAVRKDGSRRLVKCEIPNNVENRRIRKVLKMAAQNNIYVSQSFLEKSPSFEQVQNELNRIVGYSKRKNNNLE